MGLGLMDAGKLKLCDERRPVPKSRLAVTSKPWYSAPRISNGLEIFSPPKKKKKECLRFKFNREASRIQASPMTISECPSREIQTSPQMQAGHGGIYIRVTERAIRSFSEL